MCRARIAVVLILGCACVVPASSQQGSCQHRTIPVSVSTKDGAPAPPLDSVNLEGTYLRKQIRVTSTVLNQEPPRGVLLLDASGSMHDPRSSFDWNFTVDLGEDMVAWMPPTFEIGLAFFSTKMVRVISPTSERQKLMEELETSRKHFKTLVTGPPRTALWAAILDAVKMFDRPRLGDSVYVITDGGDNASIVKMKDVAQTLGEGGVRLFAFVFQKDNSPVSPEERSGPENVLKLVDDTGGTIVAYHYEYHNVFLQLPAPALFDKSGKPTHLGALLGSQYRQIFNFYRVDIDLPEAVDKPRELKLDLVGFSKPQRNNLVLTYPHMLVPCH
jgi:hypothetical protein